MRLFLILILALSGLLQVVLGGLLAFQPALALAQFGMSYPGGLELDSIALFFGLTLIGLGCSGWYAAIRTNQGRSIEVLPLVNCYGLLLCFTGLAGAILAGRMDVLFIDLLRGLLIVISAFWIHREETSLQPNAK